MVVDFTKTLDKVASVHGKESGTLKDVAKRIKASKTALHRYVAVKSYVDAGKDREVVEAKLLDRLNDSRREADQKAIAKGKLEEERAELTNLGQQYSDLCQSFAKFAELKLPGQNDIFAGLFDDDDDDSED